MLVGVGKELNEISLKSGPSGEYSTDASDSTYPKYELHSGPGKGGLATDVEGGNLVDDAAERVDSGDYAPEDVGEDVLLISKCKSGLVILVKGLDVLCDPQRLLDKSEREHFGVGLIFLAAALGEFAERAAPELAIG